MKNKETRYLKIKKRIYPMKQHSDLFSIDDKKYSDYLPTAKKYDTKKAGHNSKDRMALLMFKRVIAAYLKFFFEDLIYTGRTIKLPVRESASIKLKLKCNTDYSFIEKPTTIHNHVIVEIYFYDKFYRTKLNILFFSTYKLRDIIVKAYREGTRYNNLNNDFIK
jgi:hypothetical protein